MPRIVIDTGDLGRELETQLRALVPSPVAGTGFEAAPMAELHRDGSDCVLNAELPRAFDRKDQIGRGHHRAS